MVFISYTMFEKQPVTATQGVISNLLDKALRHQDEFTVWGDGSAVRDYLYARDAASAFVKAAHQKGKYKIYNIGDGKGHHLNHIISMVEEITHRKMRVKYLPARRFDVPVNVLDISRAKVDLGWQPEIELYKGIEHTYRWMGEEYSNADAGEKRV